MRGGIHVDSDERAPLGRRLRHWFLPIDTLVAAHGRWRRRLPSATRHLASARAAHRLARLALPFEDLPRDAHRQISDLLYSEAARRCLCLLLQRDTPLEVEEALESLSNSQLEASLGSPFGLVTIRRLFRTQGSPGGEHASGEQDADPSAKRVAGALIRTGIRRHLEYPRLVIAVALRWLAVLVAVAILGIIVALSPLRRLWTSEDLLLGAHWVASSVQAGEAAVEGTLPAPANVRFFFHTAADESPWIRIEVPGPAPALSRVVIENRTDCCGSRAIPLSIELSNDGTAWDEVARQPLAFEHWSASFKSRTARFIRVRVLRPSQLHLRSVAAYR